MFAQSFIYPMCYVRDQYGPFRLMLAMGDYYRAYRILTFYTAMQHKLGIQNAYDIPAEAIPADNWNPDLDYGRLDGRWQRAEVPSYVILFARDYYRATGRLEQIAPLYPRLAYNLRVQHLSRNHLLPYDSDESYTNFEDTKPRYEQEMTDSTLLYLAACDFMIDLARLTGRKEDAAEFSELAKRTGRALINRLWLSEEAACAGFAALCESQALYAGGRFGIIQEFYVAPQFGATGLGRRLLDAVAAHGTRLGWKRLEMCTPPLPEFDRTLEFYRRNGYEVTGGRKMKRLL